MLFASLGQVPAGKSFCPWCPDTRRDVRTFYKINGNEDFLDLPLARIGVPAFDIVVARSGGKAQGLELGGDAEAVLGPLADAGGLEWE